MRTARSSSRPGWGVSTRHPPEQAPPGPGTPQDQAPPGSGMPLWTMYPLTLTPWTRHPQDQAPPRDQAPPDQAAPGAGTPLWREFLTHACDDITLPQTSLAGGNKVKGSTEWTGFFYMVHRNESRLPELNATEWCL